MQPSSPQDGRPEAPHDEEGPPGSHASVSGDVFARWGSGALLLFGVGCMFLYEMWILVLWSGEPPLGAWGLALAPLLGVVAPVALIIRRARAPVREQLWLYGLSRRQALGVVLASLGAVPVCYAAGALNATWAPPDPEYFETFQPLAPTSVSSALGGFFAVVVCVPLGEEILFRYLLLGVLARHVHAVAAAVAAGVLFAAAHVAPFVLLPIGLLGIILGLLTIWSRSLTAAWIGHALFNLFGFVELCITGDAETGEVERVALRPAILVVSTVAVVAGLALLRADALANLEGPAMRTPSDEPPSDRGGNAQHHDVPTRAESDDNERTTHGGDYFKD